MTGRSTTLSRTPDTVRARCPAIPRRLRQDLAALDPTAMCRDREDAAALTATTGAYLLVIRLDRSISFTRSNTTFRLSAGWHLYAGSAYGPGGIRARLLRHFRRDKKLHWHVDHITTAGNVAAALAFNGGRECAIAGRLSRQPAFEAAHAGFGSTDCTGCVSHLLSYRPTAARCPP